MSARLSPPLTIFSLGYWGWDTHGEKLVEVVDAAEKVAGYKPPLWIDIRLKRQGRARDFVGTTFEKIIGANRYKWMPELGNANIGTNNQGIRIAEPQAAMDLLMAVVEASDPDQDRRVIFYCACEHPCDCHRREVAKLLKKEAQRCGIPLRVPDWPGGEPVEVEMAVPDALARQVARGTKRTVPVPDNRHDLRALPHGSVLTLKGDTTDPAFIVTGPARYDQGWFLPTLNAKPVVTLAEARKIGKTIRKLHSFDFE